MAWCAAHGAAHLNPLRTKTMLIPLQCRHTSSMPQGFNITLNICSDGVAVSLVSQQMCSLFIAMYTRSPPRESAGKRCRVESSPLFSHVLRPLALIGLNITTTVHGAVCFFSPSHQETPTQMTGKVTAN